MRMAVWQGTEQELAKLLDSVEHNCACMFAADRSPGAVCAAHAMLADQCVIDHLLFGYRLRALFMRGEFRLDKIGNRS